METLTRAREALRQAGLETRIVNVPLGHPGDSLGARDGDFPLTPPTHWRLGSNREGKPLRRHFAACPRHAGKRRSRASVAPRGLLAVLPGTTSASPSAPSSSGTANSPRTSVPSAPSTSKPSTNQPSPRARKTWPPWPKSKPTSKPPSPNATAPGLTATNSRNHLSLNAWSSAHEEKACLGSSPQAGLPTTRRAWTLTALGSLRVKAWPSLSFAGSVAVVAG